MNNQEIKFDPFIFSIPADWNHTFDNGKLRASKNDEIRLSIGIWDMSQVPEYTLDSMFETVKGGYMSSDVNWGVYSRITKTDSAVYQTLEYLDDPRLVLAVAEKTANGKKLALVISFAGNTGKEIETYFSVFTHVLENIKVI